MGLKLYLNKHNRQHDWLPLGRGWDEHTGRVKITSKRKVSEGLSPILPQTGPAGRRPQRIPFKLRHLHETTSFASTPLKQAISVSAAFQSISLIDFLSRQDGRFCLQFGFIQHLGISPSRAAGRLHRLGACCPSCARRRRTGSHHTKSSKIIG